MFFLLFIDSSSFGLFFGFPALAISALEVVPVFEAVALSHLGVLGHVLSGNSIHVGSLP